MENNIVVLSDREHILLRPSMYVGGISETEYNDYLYKDNEFKLCMYIKMFTRYICRMHLRT